MARVAREKSNSGIHHIMIRGINKQPILEDREDNQKLLEILKQCKAISEYNIYAYCFLGNHVHLLLKERKEGLEQIFKRIGARYVYYFNQKYKRSGHLFQDRFKSEPVEDDGYLITVLKYIHNNPVKAGLVKSAKEYPWSSYHEYINSNNLIDVDLVLGMMNKEQFIDIHNQPSSEAVLDLKEDHFRMTDAEAEMVIKEIGGAERISTCLNLPMEKRNELIKELRGRGLSIRQISRVTGIGKGIIERV
ncbi:transposase [uncultured Sporomusa sp.]|uniref:Transposase n=1 Tax=uncultured Sporomusa sp. TaxID=307249 RepID=A0A212LN60_9FIRM|nr:transposase [uncultured Sporomusa sp.]SCM78957.1 transposase [uncultured Sporomusa sp.]